jgi:hypothetical protein
MVVVFFDGAKQKEIIRENEKENRSRELEDEQDLY